MSYSSQHTTVGQLIKKHRELMGLTRADLAEIMDAKPVSISKYEKAGEEGGQFPPMPKMAKLCFVLNMNPTSLFWASLDKETYDAFVGKGGQMSSYYLLHDMANEKGQDAPEVRELLDEQDATSLNEASFRSLKDKFEWVDLFRKVVREEIRSELKNGPDHEDPDRSKQLTNNSEAASTASTKEPEKGNIDDVIS